MVTLTQELDAIFQERLGLSLDANALTRAEAWVRTQADTELSLRCWLDSLRAWDAGSPAVRGAISVVTNGMTYFMRDPNQLGAVRAWMKERYAQRRHPLSVWCAGCSSGEEAYTLSMLSRSVDVPVRIVASDVSVEALERARRGVYDAWALRQVTPQEREAFFVPAAHGYEVRPGVREQVTFTEHNLMSARPLLPQEQSAWDLIACRNVLIYFSEAARLRVLSAFERVLRREGALVLSSSESLRGHLTELVARRFEQGFVYVFR